MAMRVKIISDGVNTRVLDAETGKEIPSTEVCLDATPGRALIATVRVPVAELDAEAEARLFPDTWVRGWGVFMPQSQQPDVPVAVFRFSDAASKFADSEYGRQAIVREWPPRANGR